MNNLVLRLNDSNSPQQSPEGVNLIKIVSSVSPANLLKLMHVADNKVNPREAKVNKVTKSIQETLDYSPSLMWFKAKGILVGSQSCRILERNRVELTFEDLDTEGYVDGSHTALAVSLYILDKLYDNNLNLRTWEDMKRFFHENYEDIIARFKEREAEFKFSIPLEIIAPNGQDGSLEEYYDHISEICSGRNNNVQLTETAKGHQVGYYDYLKAALGDQFEVIWKSGGAGKIRSEDVISLACLPLVYLLNNRYLPEDTKGLNKISIYSHKSKCVDFFNSIMGHKEISRMENGKHKLDNSYVESALDLVPAILRFFDILYMEFPELYQRASPGRFGGISSVDNNRKSKAPFFTIQEMLPKTYPPAYIYPIVCGLTSLMEIDEEDKVVKWKFNPVNLDLGSLDLSQYVNIIKLAQFDPQKVGKGEVFYREAENAFARL